MRTKARQAAIVAAVLVAVAIVFSVASQVAREQHRVAERARLLTHGGDSSAGPSAVAHYGCGGCHDIPGVTGAHGTVGPPLGGFGERAYVAGELRNTPDNLMRWIMHPHAVEPNTAMPEMAVTERDARDIAAYLYTLE